MNNRKLQKEIESVENTISAAQMDVIDLNRQLTNQTEELENQVADLENSIEALKHELTLKYNE